MTPELARLTASVTALTSVDDSLIALVEGLAQQIRDAAHDPAAISALADSIDSEAAKISAAITANTL